MGLLDLLAARHADDVFVTECKDGPSQTRAHRRLDAWVLVKTWSPVTTIGYELKETRSDWLRDQKFLGYRDLCHLLYVVAPKGVVEKAELPDGVGLLEPIGQGDGQRLVTRRKAARQDITLPTDLLLYVLMSRTRIVASGFGARPIEDTREERTERWRDVAAGHFDRRQIGAAVSRRLYQRISDAEQRAEAAEQRARALETADRVCRDLLGVDPSIWEHKLRREMRRAMGISDIEALGTAVTRFGQAAADASTVLADVIGRIGAVPNEAQISERPSRAEE